MLKRRCGRGVVLALALAVIAGCAGSAGGEEQFAEELGGQDVAPSEQLSTTAREACERIEQGTDTQAVEVVFAMRNDLPLDRAGQVLAAGVRAFCPEQQGALDAGG